MSLLRTSMSSLIVQQYSLSSSNPPPKNFLKNQRIYQKRENLSSRASRCNRVKSQISSKSYSLRLSIWKTKSMNTMNNSLNSIKSTLSIKRKKRNWSVKNISPGYFCS